MKHLSNLLRHDDPFARNNAISAFLMGAMAAAGGSVISFMLGCFFAWGIISVAFGRFPLRLTDGDRIVAYAFTFFAAAILLTALVGDHPERAPARLIWLLTFLSVWIVIPRLRKSEHVEYLPIFIIGASIGALLALVLALFQTLVLGIRPEGGAGNAAVFAMLALLLTCLSSLDLQSPSLKRRRLAAIGLVSGLAALAASLTRGVWLVGLASLPIALILYPRRLPSRHLVLGAAGVVALLLLVFAEQLSARFAQTLLEFHDIAEHGHSRNIGERLRLWSAALAAVADAPLFGYGIQNRMEVVAAYAAGDGLPPPGFTHAHNSLLTVALDGGLLAVAALAAVLAAPTAAAWRAPPDEFYRLRLFAAILIAFIYLASGMTQIMFNHDVLDAFYVFSAMMITVSIPDRRLQRVAGEGGSPA